MQMKTQTSGTPRPAAKPRILGKANGHDGAQIEGVELPPTTSASAAGAIWDRCDEASPEHPYVRRKQGVADGLRVLPHGDPLTIAGQPVAGWLVVPLRELGSGQLVSLQFIAPSGKPMIGGAKPASKLMLPGSMKDGAFVLGDLADDSHVVVTEGLGQAWACRRVSGGELVVVVACGWARVRKVVQALQARHPDAMLALVPDAGLEQQAQAIAEEVACGHVVIPEGLAANTGIDDIARRDGDEVAADLLRRACFPALKARTRRPAKASALPETKENIAKVVDALGHLSPDMAYPDWLRVLAAVHSLGWASGLDLAEQWSSHGDKYKPGEVETRWASFEDREHEAPSTVGTIFWMAQAAGWDWAQTRRRQLRDGLDSRKPVTPVTDVTAPVDERGNEPSVTDVTDVTDSWRERAGAMLTGAELLDAVLGFLKKYVSYPSDHAAIAHALWVAHAHAIDAWESTPRIAFLSPEPASGKSRALEASELLVPRPVLAINTTPAYLFRRVADPAGLPTILFDEIDTVFGPRTRESNEEIRGLLNAGHRRGAVAGRCVVKGNTITTEEIPAFCAVVLAGLGDLPDTIMTRAVVVRMRRRAPGELVTPFRRRDAEAEGKKLHDALQRWLVPRLGRLEDARPAMPDGVADRDADVWESLLAVADEAGGDWPEKARAAATALVAESKQTTPSLGIRLLTDLKTIFKDHAAMFTHDIVRALCALEESPWGDLRGKPIDARGIASRLAPFGAKSRTVRVDGETAKGYSRQDLHDAWVRYCTPLSSSSDVTSVTRVTKLPNIINRGQPRP